ncbi:MAG: mandelate racemase/muconate lactonizing enzyme family protein [Acidobacteria bacterium]|nr:mandelate racemase/muconate lactonizing enzyme family protein [Acidobacteriota bacterium]
MATIDRAEVSRLRYRLDSPVGGSGVSLVDVVVVDLVDSDGATGLGFTYAIGGGGEVVLAAARSQVQRHLVGRLLIPPQALWRQVASGFARTGLGPNLVALAAIDVAAWDLDARRRGVPLVGALGGVPRAVRVYGSGGFNAGQSPSEAADVAVGHARRGLGAVKPRVRGDRADLAVMDAVRAALPDHVHVMVDANEKCDPASARWLLAAARQRGVLFVEEPIAAAAVDGYRALAASGGATMAAGEHLQGRAAFLTFIAERLIGVVQPDLAMAGGLTPVLEVAALAEAFGVAVSPHFLPGLFVHVAAASPALTWLEEFPLLEPLVEGWPPLLGDGTLAPRDVPGHGLSIEKRVRDKYAA